METCPCGSGRPYEDCCGPYIAGKAKPATAEALMRSRYTAYAKKEIDYIVQSCLRDEEHDIDVEATRRWAESRPGRASRSSRPTRAVPTTRRGPSSSRPHTFREGCARAITRRPPL